MPQDTKVFLIHLNQSEIEGIFVDILEEGVNLEMLDPKEISSRWQNISFLENPHSSILEKEKKSKLEKLEKVIQKYNSPFCFEDDIETGNITKVLENWNEKNLFEAVEKLSHNSIINKKYLQQKSILRKTKNGWRITILKDLKALYTKYEINFRINQITNSIFKLNSSTTACFACFAAPQIYQDFITKSLTAKGVDFEITAWTKPIIAIDNPRFATLENDNKNLPRFSPTSFDQKYLWLNSFLTCLLASIVIHDIFAGFIILIISIISFRFNLKKPFMTQQLWVGFGSIIFGIIGGSFGGNWLSTFGNTRLNFVTEAGNMLKEFLTLFQIADWTNANPTLLLNSILKDFNFLIVFGFSLLSIGIVSLAIILHSTKSINLKHYKSAIVELIFTVNLIITALYALGFLSIWFVLLFLIALLVYQPSINFSQKIKSFVGGQFGLLGFLKIGSSLLWFCLLFGLMIGSTYTFNTVNKTFDGNIIVQALLNLIAAIVLWQIAYIATKKTLYHNFLILFLDRFDETKQKIFNPLVDYKYWKF